MGSARDDLAIRGGFVVDGTGTPGREADVVVRGDRIVAVGPGVGRGARRVIDARDRMVAPGFIDIHTHSDFTLPLNPRAESKIRQRVTTEVVGNCGFSVAPALPGKAAMLGEYLAASAPGLEFRETTSAEYLRTFQPTSVNTVMQVGHNTPRLMTVGMARRAATPDELGPMARLLEEALDAGRIGRTNAAPSAPSPCDPGGRHAASPCGLTRGRAVTRREGPGPRGAMTENGLYVSYAPSFSSG